MKKHILQAVANANGCNCGESPIGLWLFAIVVFTACFLLLPGRDANASPPVPAGPDCREYNSTSRDELLRYLQGPSGNPDTEHQTDCAYVLLSGNASAMPELLNLVSNKNIEVQRRAACLLDHVGSIPGSYAHNLILLYQKSNLSLQSDSCFPIAIANTHTDEAAVFLVDFASKDKQYRMLDFLLPVLGPVAVPPLLHAMERKDMDISERIFLARETRKFDTAEARAGLKDFVQEILPKLVREIESPSAKLDAWHRRQTRSDALRRIQELGPLAEGAGPVLLNTMRQDPDSSIQFGACEALETVLPPNSESTLKRIQIAGSPNLQQCASAALANLKAKKSGVDENLYPVHISGTTP